MYGHAEVVIVGAGLTGLALACALAQGGVACRVIDRRAERSLRSKANLINPRTIEALVGLGVGDRLLAEGVPTGRTRIYRAGRVVVDFTAPPFPQTPYPYALHLSQPQLEAALIARLEELGGKVERGVALRTLRQARHGVAAHLTGPQGDEEVTGAFLVGCDGAYSTVREGLGLSFVGDAYPESFVVADVYADWAHPAATNLIWLHRDGVMLAWACPEPGLWHLFFNLTVAQDRAIATPTLADLQGIVAERTGDGRVVLSEPLWLSKFAVQRRRVEQYRVGRVFLAGDAAHIHSPMVGKGLGLGIQDGVSLGRRLVAVLRGHDDISRLGEYERERLPVSQQVFRESHATHRLLIPRNDVACFARDALVPLLRRSGAQRWLLAHNFQL